MQAQQKPEADQSSTAHKILTRLDGEVKPTLHEMISENVSEEHKFEAFRYVDQKIEAVKQLVQAMENHDMEPDLYRSLSVMWLELQMEWQRYNDVISYQLFKGDADPMAVISGSLVSSVQQTITDVLKEDDVERLFKVYEDSVPI